MLIIGQKVFHPELTHTLETISSKTNELPNNNGGTIASARGYIELPFDSGVKEEGGKDAATADGDDTKDGERELAKEFGAENAEQEVCEAEACAVEDVPPSPFRQDGHERTMIFSKAVCQALEQ